MAYTLKGIIEKTLVWHVVSGIRRRFHERFVLPRIKEAVCDDVVLDLSGMLPEEKRGILAGVYEWEEKSLIAEHLSSSDRVVEIGGAIGFLALFCRKKLDITHYLILEANPDNVSRLERNFSLNNLKATVWNVALTESDGDVDLKMGDLLWNSSLFDSRDGSISRNFRVSGISFSTLLQRLPFSASAMIIDIEGAEQYIVDEYFPETVRKIIIELHPGIIGVSKAYAVLNMLMNIGFSIEAKIADCFYLYRSGSG